MMIIFYLLVILNAQMRFQEEVLISIQVWGEVRSPGIYQVPTTTNLVEAISFAGGPTSRSDLGRVKLVKAIKGKKMMFYDVNAYIKGEKRNPPILDSGDLVYIPQSFTSRVVDFVRFAGIVAAITFTIYRITAE
ncbi:SLBB domain-containing protein [candidate division WOR-3 bacterium]|nr:SLBB domain-containing protein [candidate division WOR-3 bacterium]